MASNSLPFYFAGRPINDRHTKHADATGNTNPPSATTGRGDMQSGIVQIDWVITLLFEQLSWARQHGELENALRGVTRGAES